MSKTTRINKLTLFIAVITICTFLLLVSSFIRLQQTQTDAAQYKKAAFCQDRDDCRKKVDAEIIQSLTIEIAAVQASGKQNISRPARIASYAMSVKLSNGEIYHAKILPNLHLSTEAFNIKNIYLPVPENADEKMAETSFPRGRKVKIEMWKHKPTIIYADFVLGAPALEQGDEYAIPTTDNPLVYDLLANYDFKDIGITLGMVILLWVALQIFLNKKTASPLGRHHHDHTN